MKLAPTPGRLLAGALLLAGILRAEVMVNTGFDYSTGDYGLPVSTEIITVPFSVSYVINRTTWEIGLPYVRVDGPGEVVPGIGRANRRLLRSKEVTQGLGDLTLAATHDFSADDRPWSWAVGGEFKFGTADAEKSLGTGKDDFAAHVDLYYTTGSFTPFATLGHRWLGNPPGADLRNFFFGTLGLSWTCTEQTTLTFLVDWAEKNSDASTSSVNYTLSASRAFGEHWHAQLYGVLGSSDSSADHGMGVGLSRRF